ncbi:hypothetical protein [Streptomyces sp. bgisy060]|uniref:hypothetical protein n=1 Tax=Streptomyces sp. bgisy060 TaxID=3413775 RepID=UPI003EB77439
MSDRQTFTARAEAVLRRADDLITKTNARAHHNLIARELDQIERDRQEAGLLIQSAAVWAQLAHVAQAAETQALGDLDTGERGTGPNPLATR